MFCLQHPHPIPPLKGEGADLCMRHHAAQDASPKPLPLEGRGWGGGAAPSNGAMPVQFRPSSLVETR